MGHGTAARGPARRGALAGSHGGSLSITVAAAGTVSGELGLPQGCGCVSNRPLNRPTVAVQLVARGWTSNLLKPSKIEFVQDPAPPLTLPDGAFPPKWLEYIYMTAHPALRWLPTNLYEVG